MRILRLRLKNYRGIADREVRFAEQGVTVVSGPNEVGKSSLAEAIDLVFDELDSTTKQRVRDVQPVHRDAGAEIEVDVETGPYAFTYAKRFQRRARTQLTVTRPKLEHRSGREAHQRVRAILDETLDLDLWRALRIQQGQGLVQASWGGAPALAAALDRAAGAAPTDREEGLLEAAAAEAARYFTKTGRPRRQLAAAEREAGAARQRAEQAGQDLAKLEGDVARAEELRSVRAACELAVRQAEQELREQEQRFEPVVALRDALATAVAQRDLALAEEREARQRARERGRLVAAHAAAEADLAHRAEEIESGEPALLGARAELEHAESAFRDAREALEEASRRVASLRGDLELQRTRQDLAQWKRRREQVQAASRAVDEVREKLRANPLDEAAVRAVQQAERAVDRARTRVETEGPLLQLTPQVPLQATLDGRGVTLEAGETVEHRVAESLLLSLPGVADLTLVAGAGAAERVKVLEQAKTRFRECCAAWGVDDHADAVRTFAAREEAERRLAEHEQLLRDALGDETPDGLDARVAALEARRDTLEAERADLFPAPPDTDAAQALLDESEQAHERARADFDDAGRRRDALVGRHRQLSEQHRETAVRLELAQRSFGDLDERLAAARAEASDDSLREEQELRSARARQFEKTASDASEALAALDPEGTEARLSRARHQREQRARELARVHDEATEVAARLQVRGEAGLYEHVETARAEADRAERHARSLARRAAAAKRLLETLRAERDATRDGYAEPLVRRIEELGALVFDDGFAVELDDELRVARRILHGTSLRFDQLSAGAREQIALLARLAVATLVASDGGAPLVIDDALGHSDPQRLARIGRALGAAAPHCQIVVLTCTPDRYRHVESAHAVQLG